MDFKLQEGGSSLVKVVEKRGERLLWDVRRGESCADQAEDKEKAVRKQNQGEVSGAARSGQSNAAEDVEMTKTQERALDPGARSWA